MASGALGGQEGAILLEVGADQEPHGGVTAAVVRPSLLSMAVPAPAGEAAAAVGVELLDGFGCPAACAALARRLVGHARVGTLVAHLGGSFQVRWLPAQVALRRGRFLGERLGVTSCR